MGDVFSHLIVSWFRISAEAKCHQTKRLMRKTKATHMRFESLYISLPSSAKQQRELTKFYVFWRTRTAMATF